MIDSARPTSYKNRAKTKFYKIPADSVPMRWADRCNYKGCVWFRIEISLCWADHVCPSGWIVFLSVWIMNCPDYPAGVLQRTLLGNPNRERMDEQSPKRYTKSKWNTPSESAVSIGITWNADLYSGLRQFWESLRCPVPVQTAIQVHQTMAHRIILHPKADRRQKPSRYISMKYYPTIQRSMVRLSFSKFTPTFTIVFAPASYWIA